MVIYKITNATDGKIYIGVTLNLDERIKKHRRANTEIGKAIRKCGFESFTVEVLAETDNSKTARELERFYISEFNSQSPKGYNRSAGGEWHRLTEEQRENLRQKTIGRFTGEKNFFYGKQGTNTGKFGKDHPVFGYKHTEKVKAAKRAAWTGENNPNYGKRGAAHPCSGAMSEEHKAKISAAMKKPRPDYKGGGNPSARRVRNVETGEVFSCQKEAAEKCGVGKTAISKACRNERRTAGGYHWEYAD